MSGRDRTRRDPTRRGRSRSRVLIAGRHTANRHTASQRHLLKSPRDAIHVGFVTEGISESAFGTIEGNAADPSRPPTREGFGVFERKVTDAKARRRGPQYVYIRYRQGS
jgi:hypothetical protein